MTTIFRRIAAGMRREPHPWLLAAAVIAFFHRPLTVDTFYFRDLYLLFYGKKRILAEALSRGSFPLWDPLTNGGQPYLSPANTPFYPSNVLYLFLSPLAAFNAAIVLHYLLCALSAYALARVMNLSPRAAFVAGSVYALCGFTLSSGNLLFIFSLPWIPASVALVQLYVRHRRTRWFVASALATAMPLLAGGVEMTAAMFVLIAAWLIGNRLAPMRTAALLCLLVASSAGLAMVQILPALEMMGESSRSARRTYTAFTDWSVDVRRLPELVVPRFLGDTDTLDDRDFWGSRIETAGFPYILSIYFGFPALILAAFGAGKGERDETALLRRILVALVVVSIVLSLGRAMPFFPLIYKLPFVAIFRFPVKALILALLPVAILAACGVDRLHTARSRAVTLACATAALIAGCLFAALHNDAFASAFGRLFFLQPLGASNVRLASSVMHAAAVSVAAAAALFISRSRPNSGPVVLGLIIFIDLAAAGIRVNAWAPRALFEPPPVVPAVKQVIEAGRFHDDVPGPAAAVAAPSNDLFWLARRNLEILDDYNAATFGIPVIFHNDYDGLAPSAIVALRQQLNRAPWEIRRRVFAAAGVRALITREPLRGSEAIEIGRIAEPAGPPLRVFALPDVQPIRFVSDAESVATPAAALERMGSGRFEPERLLITGSASHAERCAAQSLRVIRPSAEQIRVEVDAPCRGYIYFAETFYPGWRARVDGIEQPILRANYAFSAIAIPSGRHIVERVYRPRMAIVGGMLSAIAFVVIACAALVVRWRSRRDRAAGGTGMRY